MIKHALTGLFSALVVAAIAGCTTGQATTQPQEPPIAESIAPDVPAAPEIVAVEPVGWLDGFPRGLGDYELFSGSFVIENDFACSGPKSDIIYREPLDNAQYFGVKYLNEAAAQRLVAFDGFCTFVSIHDGPGVLEFAGVRHPTADEAAQYATSTVEGDAVPTLEGVYCNTHEDTGTQFCSGSGGLWSVALTTKVDGDPEAQLAVLRGILVAFLGSAEYVVASS